MRIYRMESGAREQQKEGEENIRALGIRILDIGIRTEKYVPDNSIKYTLINF